MWALVINSKVQETTDIDPVGRYHPSLQWFACGEEVQSGWTYDGQSFVGLAAVSLEERCAAKVNEVNQHCEAAITAGFWSAALGSAYFYSSQLEDQVNLTGVVLRAQPSLYPCRDEQGVKEFRLHSAEQLFRVGDDFTVFKLQHLQRANMLKQQLNQALAATDWNALEAVTWGSAQP
ncbi:DUF4376 domain-containing protein [Pseudomonas putida]|uniref:DUF4376 domain-containing protein n=1 Tax=Pseudomonas putida TaxID=303 RepID=UPI001C223347|nr:hypothetical protein [Pseudomonas putida]